MPTSSSSDQSGTGNRLLDALAPDALAALRPHLDTIVLRSREVVQDLGGRAEYVYFPTSGVISIVAIMTDGTGVEAGMVGKEGVFSVPALLGDDTPSVRGIVQLEGSSVRIRATILRQALQADQTLSALLMRHVLVTLTTATQSAACNRLHTLEQRCARWLLSVHDRAGRDTFPMTHEFLSIMLGVRRPGVTVAVQSYRDSGLLTYNHGTLTINDRDGLERASCECYRFIRDESTRMFG